jgi:hypothetical protein
MRTLHKGNDANSLRLLTDNIELQPTADMKKGMIDAGVIVKISRYNLDDLLCQMLEDYGEEVLIAKIKSLE